MIVLALYFQFLKGLGQFKLEYFQGRVSGNIIYQLYKLYFIVIIQKLSQMAHLQQIANNLMRTSESNTAVIKEAQSQLEKFSKDENFINLLLAIPQMEGVSPQLCRIACIYSLTYARNIVLWRNQSSINIAAQQMFNFISNNSIDFKYKDQVGAALQYLIQKDQNNVIVYAFLSNMMDILQSTLTSSLNQINIQFIAVISETLVDKVVPATGQQADKYIYQSFISLSQLVAKIIQLGATSSSNQSTLERILLIVVKLLKTLKKYIRKFMYFNSKIVQTVYSLEFLQLIKSALNYNLPQNTASYPIFYVFKVPVFNAKIIEYFHNIKGLIIYILTQSLRLVIYSKNNTSSQSNVMQSQIIQKCPEFITVFTNAVNQLLQRCPYYKFGSKLKFKIIQQIYNFIIACLRSGKFYNVLNENRALILFSCVFKTLAFSPEDYDNYYNDSEQYVNSLFQIVQLDAGLLAGNEKADMEDQSVSIQIFDTLKTHSANLLKNYVKYIDGSLAQIVFYIINVIDDKINLQLSKNLMFLLLCILRDEMKTRNDFLYKIKKLVFKNLQDLQIPVKKTEQPYNVEYSLSLFTLNHFLILFNQLVDDSYTIQRSFQICQKLLKNDKVETVPKMIAVELILSLLFTQESSLYARRTIELFNRNVSIKKLNLRYLQCIEQIVKENGSVFKNQYSMLIQMIQKISAYLLNQLSNPQKEVQVIDKIWHILQQVICNKDINILLVDTIKRAIQPFINLINGQNQIELEDKVYHLMEKLVNITGGIGQFQIQILSILPKTFYTGKKKRSLSTCFSLLQLIILYGRQTLTTDAVIVKNLILLCIQGITSKTVNQIKRNQADCLQGILLIQSLIISAGSSFTQEIWVTITSCLAKKLKNQIIVYDFVKAPIVATLSLTIQAAFGCFSAEDNQQLIKLILTNYASLTFQEQSKLFIISMSGLLQRFNLPFVIVRFHHILDCIVTLLKQSTTLKETKVDESQLDQEHKHFLKLVKQVRNCYKGIDEYQYFKSAIHNLKESNRALLEAAIVELPQVKQAYFKDLMSMRKINEQARIIYRVKGNHKSNESTAM